MIGLELRETWQNFAKVTISNGDEPLFYDDKDLLHCNKSKNSENEMKKKHLSPSWNNLSISHMDLLSGSIILGN